ncbi:hypothetical protein INR49_003972 [Caranx melampygus]|nr:hypothetical protein INR49_003972 [Caranx melampygus]
METECLRWSKRFYRRLWRRERGGGERASGGYEERSRPVTSIRMVLVGAKGSETSALNTILGETAPAPQKDGSAWSERG